MIITATVYKTDPSQPVHTESFAIEQIGPGQFQSRAGYAHFGIGEMHRMIREYMQRQFPGHAVAISQS